MSQTARFGHRLNQRLTMDLGRDSPEWANLMVIGSCRCRDYGSILGSVLGPYWHRPGTVLALFWHCSGTSGVSHASYNVVSATNGPSLIIPSWPCTSLYPSWPCPCTCPCTAPGPACTGTVHRYGPLYYKDTGRFDANMVQ